MHFASIAVEHANARIGEDGRHFLLLAGFEVMIAQDGNDGNLDGGPQLTSQCVRLLRQTVVGQVASQEENVGTAGHLGEQRLERAGRGLIDMDVRQGRHPNLLERHKCLPQSAQSAGRRATTHHSPGRQEDCKTHTLRHAVCDPHELPVRPPRQQTRLWTKPTEEAFMNIQVPGSNDLPARTRAIYEQVLCILTESPIPFLVGGAYALHRYTGIERHTKDMDIFVRPGDAPRVLDLFAARGYRVELTFSHWLGKIFQDGELVDIIFSSGNGTATVDDEWFMHSVADKVLGLPVQLCPAEEMIWSKGFVMERERYDGADICHLIRSCRS